MALAQVKGSLQKGSWRCLWLPVERSYSFQCHQNVLVGFRWNRLRREKENRVCVAASSGGKTTTLAGERKNTTSIGDITKYVLYLFLHTEGKHTFAFPICTILLDSA
jgi:hypothetical protein